MAQIVAYHRVSRQMRGIDGLSMAGRRRAVNGFAATSGQDVIARLVQIECSMTTRLVLSRVRR
jgi:hypothetical protein